MKKRTKIHIKKKKRTITSLKKELWRYFSTYIKHRDGFKCFTCNSFVSGHNAHAGHFVPSSLCGLGLRYDPMNVHCQCYKCNIYLSGNYVTYREKMVEKHGESTVVELEARRHQVTKDFDYDAEIEKYKTLCEQMGITVR